jgi:hypothetical protein
VGSIPAQCKNLCALTSLIVLGLGVYMYNMYVFTKRNVFEFINPLSRIHTTSLISAYFGLDDRECKCLEYLFIYLIDTGSASQKR